MPVSRGSVGAAQLERAPTGLVVDPPLVLGQEVARPEVCQEMDQTNLAPSALDLADGRAQRRVVGRAPGEQMPELRFGFEQTRAIRLRLREHRVHQLPHLGFLARWSA